MSWDKINKLLFPVPNYTDQWLMSPSTRCTLAFILQSLKPECSIEVGTYNGGSLAILSDFSKKVYSLDINPSIKNLGDKFKNVEFLVGDSQVTFPQLLKKIEMSKAKLSFVLLDGDKTTKSICGDINHLLEYTPQVPLVVLMHDCFNPLIRKGIYGAKWKECRHVHYLEMDFVCGVFHEKNPISREMWGGFSLALLLPEKREKELIINADQELLFKTIYSLSAHSNTFWKRVKRKIISFKNLLSF